MHESNGFKLCKRCNTVKPVDGFTTSKKSSDGCQCYCKKCYAERLQERRNANPELMREADRKWKQNNKEKTAAYKKRYREQNQEKVKLQRKLAYEKNKEKELAKGREYKEKNKEKLAAYQSKKLSDSPEINRYYRSMRRAAERTAKPSWANNDKIKEFYILSRKLTEADGIERHVDHIVPLKSKLVCGLHCEQNLQVITKKENLTKLNHYWPDMP